MWVCLIGVSGIGGGMYVGMWVCRYGVWVPYIHTYIHM
jgi:hypothetical protein